MFMSWICYFFIRYQRQNAPFDSSYYVFIVYEIVLNRDGRREWLIFKNKLRLAKLFADIVGYSHVHYISCNHLLVISIGCTNFLQQQFNP